MAVGTLDPASGSVPETFRPSVDEVLGVVEETETSDWRVLSSVTLRGGVDSEESSGVEVCWCSVASGCLSERGLSLGHSGLPVSEPFPVWVTCCSVASLLSVLVVGALWV